MTKSGQFERLSQSQLAAAFGCSRQAVAKWACPRNRDRTYCLKAVVAWYVSREAERAVMEQAPGEALERWRSARASMAELDLARARGETIAVADVKRQWSALVIMIRDNLLRLPDALAVKLAACGSAAQVSRVLEDAIRETLTKMSTAPLGEEGE